jgi:hypothetical protein
VSDCGMGLGGAEASTARQRGVEEGGGVRQDTALSKISDPEAQT